MLDEGLAILDGLWSGQPFGFDGEFYHLHEMTFLPTPVQHPRIPVWVGGWWPNRAPARRAARWDGAYIGRLDGPMRPEDILDLVAYSHDQRATESPLMIVVGDRSATINRTTIATRIAELAEAGATWWLEKAGVLPMATVEERIRQGPPRP